MASKSKPGEPLPKPTIVMWREADESKVHVRESHGEFTLSREAYEHARGMRPELWPDYSALEVR